MVGFLLGPQGFECGSVGFWLLYFGAVPWVLAFAFGFRPILEPMELVCFGLYQRQDIKAKKCSSGNQT